MEAGDVTNQGSEPWANRRKAIPSRTWTGKVVYPHPPSRRHFWTVRDAQRIIDHLVVPEGDDGTSWASKVIEMLRHATIVMMERMLWFLDDRHIQALYDWGISLLDGIFHVETQETVRESTARRLIIYIADKAGLSVTIKK